MAWSFKPRNQRIKCRGFCFLSCGLFFLLNGSNEISLQVGPSLCTPVTCSKDHCPERWTAQQIVER